MVNLKQKAMEGQNFTGGRNIGANNKEKDSGTNSVALTQVEANEENMMMEQAVKELLEGGSNTGSND